MAIAAGHDGVDEIPAALDRRVGASPADECQRGKSECCKPQHDAPSPIPDSRARIIIIAPRAGRQPNLRCARRCLVLRIRWTTKRDSVAALNEDRLTVIYAAAGA